MNKEFDKLTLQELEEVQNEICRLEIINTISWAVTRPSSTMNSTSRTTIRNWNRNNLSFPPLPTPRKIWLLLLSPSTSSSGRKPLEDSPDNRAQASKNYWKNEHLQPKKEEAPLLRPQTLHSIKESNRWFRLKRQKTISSVRTTDRSIYWTKPERKTSSNTKK